MVLSMVGWAVMVFAVALPAVEYDPVVAEIIQSVSEDSLISTIEGLSGEVPVNIGGEPDSIPCRYAHTSGCYRAALWLAERLESEDIEVEFQPFLPMSFLHLDLIPSGYGWACADLAYYIGNVLFRTQDAGASWQVLDWPDPDSTWEDVAAISEDTAWALMSNKIMRTVDGETWQARVELESWKSLHGLSAVGSRRGWAVGYLCQNNSFGGIVVSTTDAWETWEEDFSLSDSLVYVDFVSPNTGWVASVESLWVTADAGESWLKQDHLLIRITGMDFADSLSGYLIGVDEGGRGAICRTTDGGETWQALIDTLRFIPQDILLIGLDTVWVVGSGGLALFSGDGGETWASKDLGTRGYMEAMDFASDGRGVAVGRAEIRYTPDGESWQMPDTTDLSVMWNVIGTLEGQDSTEVLIGAHYDAFVSDEDMRYIYTPGADDNASGVSAVLEAARLLAEHDWKHTLKFILFAAEEIDLWGSYRYAQDERWADVLGFLNADMIAYDSNDDRLLEVNAWRLFNPLSLETANIFSEVVDVYNLNLMTRLDTMWQPGDAMCLWVVGMPGISIIEDHDDFNPFYHTINDRLHNLDTDYMTDVARVSVGWVAHMADLESLDIEERELLQPAELVSLSLSSSIIRYQAWLEIRSPHTVTPCIYDASGRRVKTLPSIMPACAPQRLRLELADLPAGVYWISVQGTRGLVSERFVLIR